MSPLSHLLTLLLLLTCYFSAISSTSTDDIIEPTAVAGFDDDEFHYGYGPWWPQDDDDEIRYYAWPVAQRDNNDELFVPRGGRFAHKNGRVAFGQFGENDERRKHRGNRKYRIRPHKPHHHHTHSDDDQWRFRSRYCPLNYAPVCGTNGKTYSNSCFASRSGAKVQYKGRCKEQQDQDLHMPTGDPVALWGGALAWGHNFGDDDQFFRVSNKLSKRFRCICPMNYAPVCGTNGKSYSNSCSASCSGVKVQYKGHCKEEQDQDLKIPIDDYVAEPSDRKRRLARALFRKSLRNQVHIDKWRLDDDMDKDEFWGRYSRLPTQVASLWPVAHRDQSSQYVDDDDEEILVGAWPPAYE